MEIEICNYFKQYPHKSSEWNALVSSCANKDVLYSYEWYECWAETFGNADNTFTLLARTDGKLQAILPLIRSTYTKFGIKVNVIKSMTNLHSHRFDLICAQSDPMILGQLLHSVFSRLRTPLIVLDSVPEQALIQKMLPQIVRDFGYSYISKFDSTNCLIRVEGTFDNFFNGLDSKFKKNVRAAERKTLDRGSIELLKPAREADLDNMLPICYELESSGWKGQLGTAIIKDDTVENFYNRLGKICFKNNWLDLMLIKNSEDYLSFIFCLGNYGVIRALKIGINDRLKNIGPGMIVTKKMLEKQYAEQRFKLWDFCGGLARWKEDWSNARENYYKIFIFDNTRYGKFLYQLAKVYQRFFKKL